MSLKLSAALPALLLLTVTTPLAAQEEAGPLDVNVGLMIWTLLIFVIVLVVLGKFAWPNILGAVEKREEHIQELLKGAERDRAEAAALAEENRRILEETRAKVQEAVNGGRASAERLEAEGRERGQAEYQRLMERARADIATERQSVLEAVRRDAVELAMRAAEKLVRRTLDTEDNRRLVREYLAQAEPAAPRAAAVGARTPAGV